VRRSFRLVQKKRGGRQSGSRQAGHLGELLFFGIFLIVGLLWLLSAVWFLVIPVWRANTRFEETVCTVQSRRLVETADPDETRYRPEFEIKYRVDSQEYITRAYDICKVGSSYRDSQKELLSRFDVGGFYPCWYNPDDPNQVVLVREKGLFALLMVLGSLPFILIGGAGSILALVHWGRSTEHVAATWQKVKLDRLMKNSPNSDDLPTVPVGIDMTNSPGTTLAYRLPINASPAWKLVGLLLAAIGWNAVVAVFATIGVNSVLLGDPDWLIIVCLVPFVLIGIFLFFLFLRRLFLATAVGTTFVEISDFPLYPGGCYRVLMHQAGRIRVRSLTLNLICREVTCFREGTDTRISTNEVFCREVFRRNRFDIQRGIPFEAEVDLEIPANLMHSFRSENNEIRWRLSVEAKLTRRPDFKKEFHLIVHPQTHFDCSPSVFGNGLVPEETQPPTGGDR
jgi:Protein of unknown function (DUF3592)